ncbi:beta-N-acetylhexosaminidase [Pedobacter sp. MC2016-24]|uniref:beta-N-acetylhexosaminidase n=1 Tax=Pedobacter sp. MC2016-24 TaxID=2780090 RepID=UPI00187DF3A5|nr:beta-N-acetylhexosaminidase [Pedobacter sp. MC2016-24]MBE9601215.1 beta-N-acetylhexosaminidase [Pedobacter sp. MC2016-24]
MRRITIFCLLLLLANRLTAQQVQIIPQPAYLDIKKKSSPFVIDKNTKIVVKDSTLIKSADNLNAYLSKYFQLKLAITAKDSIANRINLTLDTRASEFDDAYVLNASKENIAIIGTSGPGVFYGIQTLLQLLPTNKTASMQIPAVSIVDHPRFSYRGMHLDVSRHFFDIEFIKTYIDYLAFHKLNNFHWHLTDDQGWRIEIKKHPKLTAISAWRNGTIIGLFPGTGNDGLRYGGYYTQEEVKEVIRYAADRYINVIPEIDVPAHSMAVLAAYPEFGTEPAKKYEVAQTWGIFNRQNNVLQPTEKTFKFLDEVLTEVIELFPSKYIHIGGDEASKMWWKQSAVSQQIMKAKGIKDESGLQSYFIHRVEQFVNSKGKTIIGWDEILDGGLAPNAIVMSWRGEKGGIAAAKQQHKVIMTPEAMMYFNHSQFLKDDSLTAAKYLPLKDVYNYEPVPAILTPAEAQYIWGAQANLWSEYIANPAKVNYMLFPRLDALSEVLWSPKEKRDFTDFQNRLKTQFKRYDMMNINYSKRYLSN